MKKVLTLLLSLCSVICQGQNQSLVNEIDRLLYDSKYNEVIQLVDGTKISNPETYVILSNKKAEALIRLGKFEEASELLKTMVADAEKTKNPELLKAITQSNIGFLYLNQGRNDLALENLQESVSSLNKSGNSLETAQALAYLGQVYYSTGKYAQAEQQLQMALSIREEKLPDTHELIAASYNELGLVYSQIDENKALDYYDLASAMYEKLHGSDHPKFAIASTNLGVVYRSMKLYGDAVNDFETALKIWEKVYVQPHPSKAFVLTNLGQTYSQMGNPNTALEFYEKALTMYETVHGKKHPEVAYTYNLIGNEKRSQRKFDEALVNYQKALIANVSDFNSTNIADNPRGKDFYNGNVLLYSMMYKAQALEERHFGKTLKMSDLDLALKNLQVCDSLIDRLRQQATNESDKISLGAIANEVYADGVRISYEASAIAFRKRPYLEQAFYFAEKSKSAVLLDAISDADAKSFAGIPDNLLEEEKNLKSAIALTAQQLTQKPSPDEEKYLRETLFSLNTAYEVFVKNLEKQFPAYFNLKFNASSPTIIDLQRLLDDKTAVLSYFIEDDKNKRIYIFLITSKTFRIIDHPLPPDFDKYLTGLRNSLYFNVMGAYSKVGYNLAKLLIPKIPSKIESLIILPTGRLGVVPFETLLTKKTKPEQTYETLPYLLKKFSVQYEFSAGLMLQKAKQPASKSTAILLCAPVTFPEKDNLNDLPGTEQEVKEISKLFASKNISNSVFTGNDANEHMLKSNNLKNYSLLHFATHGVVDENDPELSRIFLQNNSAEDGNLFAGEIYNLELNANLVTLSACETGLGKISKGEGVIGLSRALVYAGAKNLVVSFWRVADESTAELMEDFYKNILENNSGYGANLRNAKLNMIKTGKYAAPYYWAPFILIGF